VLTQVDLEVQAGSICALIGRNGSGKTTLMRCINHVLKPLQGHVRVSGHAVAKLSRPQIARLIGMVPQNGHCPFAFSCLEMIVMGAAARLSPWSRPKAGDYAKARAVSREVGIESLLNRPFHHLSGGQQQLVLLTRALYQEATLMLLDEPTAHLDFANQHKMMGLIRQVVRTRGATALVTLHDPNLALHYCDMAVMLEDGKVVSCGAVQEVITDTNLHRVLGDNIQLDMTQLGYSVVIPKQVP
jgi:iron complex transport system ATP-binding protein